jgi:PAS domain S-box-containing protein
LTRRPREIAEEPALDAERQFQLVVESIKDYAIFMIDPSGLVTTWNAGAKLIKGYAFYTPEDLTSNKPQLLLDAALAHGRVEDEGWRARKDGSRFWADVVITALRDPHGRLQGFAKVTRDLTSRMEAEQKLRESEQSLAATLYSIGDAVLAADERGCVTRINPVAERLTGWTETEAMGRPLEEVFNIVNEETRRKAPNPVTRVLAEGVVVGLANHTALIARDGTERPIADSGAPIRDAQGSTRGAVLVFRDATMERRAEEERFQLARAQEAVRLRDEFLSIASHELKTPLTALHLQLRSVREQVSSDEKLTKKVDRAQKIGDRLASLIEALLDVSRIVSGQLRLNLELFDLAEAVKEGVDRLRGAADDARSPITIEIDGPITARWDRLRIEQVLTNLISNSIKYAAGTPIHVAATVDARDAVVTVQDKGPGIAEQDLPRIFERFERAASTRHYGGMGLGLYVARQIAEAHGGSITAKNLPNGGAGFTVRLPLEPSSQPPIS